MTSAVLRLALDYWREGLVVALVLTAGLSVRGCVQERDQRVAAEALSKERLVDFRLSKSTADSLHKVLARTDSQVAVAQSHITQMRHKADSLARIADREVQAASSRLTAAGDSLSATLDSVAVIAPELGRVAQRQYREVRNAHRSVREALEDQLEAQIRITEASDSTSRLWRRRHATLEDAYQARGEALERAERVLRTRQVEDDPGWGDRIVATLAGAAIGGVMVAVVR